MNLIKSRKVLLNLFVVAILSAIGSASRAQTANFYHNMNVYKNDPSTARSACQSMRNINKLNASVFSEEALYYSANALQVTPREAKAIQVWLAGNYCPDVW